MCLVLVVNEANNNRYIENTNPVTVKKHEVHVQPVLFQQNKYGKHATVISGLFECSKERCHFLLHSWYRSVVFYVSIGREVDCFISRVS